MIDELIEKGKRSGVITYEEVIEFSEKNHFLEAETNDLLRQIEREHIDLVMQEELDGEEGAGLGLDGEEEASKAQIKAKLESSLDLQGDEFEEEEEGDEFGKATKKKKKSLVKLAPLKLPTR